MNMMIIIMIMMTIIMMNMMITMMMMVMVNISKKSYICSKITRIAEGIL